MIKCSLIWLFTKLFEYTSCRSMKPCCLRSYSWNETATTTYIYIYKPLIGNHIRILFFPSYQNVQWILSSIGAFGWNTERARANSSNPSIPLCFVSNKSKTYKPDDICFLRLDLLGEKKTLVVKKEILLDRQTSSLSYSS